MKSHYSLARRAAAVALCTAVLTLVGCGQKGPLYLPKVPPDPFAQTKPKPDATTTPAQHGSAGTGDAAQPAQTTKPAATQQ